MIINHWVFRSTNYFQTHPYEISVKRFHPFHPSAPGSSGSGSSRVRHVGDKPHGSRRSEQVIWVCLKMLCTPLYPMVLLIIIPMKNGYFIGKYWEYTQHFQTNPYVQNRGRGVHQNGKSHVENDQPGRF